MRDDRVYLKHILDAIAQIEGYLKCVSDKEFFDTPLIQDGVIRQIEIIGEAVKQLSNEFRDANPAIPWRDIAGMRDKLIHHYMGVNLEEVWLTAKNDLPMLKRNLAALINAANDSK